MGTFGAFVHDMLAAHSKTAAWLAEETGLAETAISAWKNRPKREPRPATVRGVALVFERELGIPRAQTYGAAGYPIHASSDEDERMQRLDALATASPETAREFERVANLPPSERDEVLSLLEAWFTSRRQRRRRRKST